MYTPEVILENYNKLKYEIRNITDKDIQIISVTKAHEPEIFQVCSELKIKHVGENRIQELKEKCTLFPDARKELYVHFIGNLQANKAKYLPGRINSLDTLDNLNLLEILNKKWREHKEGEDKLSVLIQINSTGEAGKSGINYNNYDELINLAKKCMDSESINLEGLMTMGPTPVEEKGETIESQSYREATERAFLCTRDLKKKLEDDLQYALPRLSMGMTHDFSIAIPCGATEIRVGSFIFGPRLVRR